MDYNIYLHTVGSKSNQLSPTKPWQTQEGSGENSTTIGDGTSPANTISRIGAFAQNPDSLIGTVMASTIGKLGVIGIAAYIGLRIADKVANMYLSYQSSASGDFKTIIEYNNFKTQIHNAFHPFSNAYQTQMNKLAIKKQNLANEQERLLTGGSVITSQYGRYL